MEEETNMNQKQLPAPPVADKIIELAERIETVKGSGPQDVQHLRRLLAELPEDLLPDCAATHEIRTDLMGKICKGVRQVFLLAETDRLKRDLGYTTASSTEQLLIEHILTLRLRVLHAEAMYNATVVDRPASIAVATYRDKLLTTTQNRYLKAIEMLTKVRRMARSTPSVQINIAQEGGQQVNVQGEVSGQRVA